MKTTPVNGSFTVDGGSDKINTSQSNNEIGKIQFTLEDSPKITWWKGIKVFDAHNNMISLVAMQDHDHGPDSTKEFTTAQFSDVIRVELWKAKFLGVHTCVGTAHFKKSDCDGKNTTLFWQND